MKEELAVKNLREVKEIFDKYGIKYWLDYGTLLGAVRDGRIIEWDDDLDLGIMSDYWKRLASALSEFEEKGFDTFFNEVKLYKDFFGRGACLHRFGIRIDIAAYDVKGENAFKIFVESKNLISRTLEVLGYLLIVKEVEPRGTPTTIRDYIRKALKRLWIRSGVRNVLTIVPKRYFEKFKTIKFYGMTFNIPFDTEGYLRLHYGKDWKVPRKKWNWIKDDGTVRIFKGRIFSKSKRLSSGRL